MCEKEVWRPPFGYEGLYLVSSFGRVRSVGRTVKGPKGPKRLKPVLLKQANGGGVGYLRVTLSKEGETKSFLVHGLILAAFSGPRPHKMECCHIDGDVSNNHISNLKWGTSRENKADMVKHGRTGKGERNGNAKLSDSERDEIRRLKGILPVDRIAVLYDVWPTTVYAVLKNT